MASCEKLIKNNELGSYPQRLTAVLMDYSEDNFNNFVESLTKSRNNLAYRTIPNSADPEKEVKDMTGCLYNSFAYLINNFDSINGKFSSEQKKTILERLKTVTDFADGTQIFRGGEAVVHEVARERGKRAQKTFTRMIGDLFGSELQSSLSKSFKRLFGNKMVSMLIHDKVAMEVYDLDNKTLNEKIWVGQAKAFKSLVDFMKTELPDDREVQALSNRMFDYVITQAKGEKPAVYAEPEQLTIYKMKGTFNLLNYNRAMNLYKEKIFDADQVKFRRKIAMQNTESYYAASRNEYEENFYKVAQYLEKNGGDNYKDYLVINGIRKANIENVKKMAFNGEKMSREANLVWNYLKENDAEGGLSKGMINDGGVRINPYELFNRMSEKVADAFYDAAVNYVFLQSFDDLLDMTMSDMITIDKARKGFESYQEGKYSYKSTTSGSEKNYIGADSYDTVDYTSDYMSALLESFDLIHYSKTSRKFSGGTLTAANLVRAIGKLREGFMSGRFNPAINNTDVKDTFMDAITNFRYDPVANAKKILEMFFEASKIENHNYSIYDRMIVKGDADENLSRTDIDTLYTFYDAFLNDMSEASIWSIMKRYNMESNETGRTKIINRAHSILNDVCGYLASNNEQRNMQTVVRGNGEITHKIARGYLDAFQTKTEKDSINMYANNMVHSKREILDDKYKFNYDTKPDEKRTKNKDKSIPTYEVTLRNGAVLRVTADNAFGIMYGDESSGEVTIAFRGMAEGQPFKDAMNGANLSMIKDAYLFGKDKGGNVSDERLVMNANDKTGNYNKQMRAVLEFVDDFLGTEFLSNPSEGFEILETYKSRYGQGSGKSGLENFMMPLIKMAMRSAYANSMYLQAAKKGMELMEYLEKSNDRLYGNYNTVTNAATNKLFHIGFNNVFESLRYNVASNKDNAVSVLADAKAYVRGESNRTTIRSATGARIPINSVSRMAQEIRMNTAKTKENNGRTTGRLMFANGKGIKDITHKLDLTAYGVSKDYSKLSRKDVYLDAMLVDFYGELGKTKDGATFYTMACDYGDKSTIFKYLVDLDEVKRTLNTDEGFNVLDIKKQDIYNGFANSLGKCYEQIFEDVTEKQERLVRRFIEKYDSDSNADPASRARAKEAREIMNAADKRLEENRNEFNAYLMTFGEGEAPEEGYNPVCNITDDAMHGEGALYSAMKKMTEEEFVEAAADYGEEAVLHVDYRTVTNAKGEKVLVPNELLRNYAETYNDTAKDGKLLKEIEKNEKVFLNTHLIEGTALQVVRRSALDYYRKPETMPKDYYERSNVVFEAVKTYCKKFNNMKMSLKDFFNEWVDDKGRLIFAKQGEKNIVYRLDFDPASEESFKLNPMVETYYLLDTLVARNLSHFVAGSEAGNELKYGSPLDIVKKMDLSMFKRESYAENFSDGMLEDVLADLKETDGIDELARKTRDIEPSDERKAIYETLLERCYDYSKSASQVTNNKRASLAISTMHPALMNSLDGVLNSYKVACLGNVEAAAWNTNGETKADVDVGEGSTISNPCQKRFEDASFGDHAIPGDVSKTVHVEFMPGYAGLFIMKQASQALSNHLMRLTEKAGDGKNINYSRIFKQMMNDQVLSGYDTEEYENKVVIGWNDSNYRRLNRLDMRDDETFMEEQLFDNDALYYRGRHGERKRIETLKYSISQETDPQTGKARKKVYYYTVECDGTDMREEIPDNEKSNVYHLFYDRTDPDSGMVEESVHITAESVEEAKRLMEKYKDSNIHTINSAYELHTALGGMWCVDAEGNWSERNLDVLTNFCNYIVLQKGPVTHSKTDYKYDQSHYSQPLKESLIAYFSPPSTMKKTIANINPTEAWYDGRKVKTFKASADGLGMQMDAGKDITEGETTESTQMISILNTGVDHRAADSLERTIGMYMVEKSGELLPLLRRFVDSQSTPKEKRKVADDLTAIIGGIVLQNGATRSYESLAESVINNVSKYMFKHATREEGESFGMPISAPEIYKDYMGTLSNFLTNEVIKREFPGAGFVLARSKDIVKLYEVRIKNKDGSYGEVEKLEPADVLERAREDYRNEMLDYLSDPKRNDKSGFEITEELDEKGEVTGHRLSVDIKAASDRLKGVNLDLRLEDMKTADLERIALEYSKSGRFSQYYTDATDMIDVNQHMMNIWLKEKTKEARTFQNREWFMPSDVVDVLDAEGKLVETINLDSMEKFIQFKKKGISPTTGKEFDKSYQYRENVTSSRDLRPSTIRWKWKDDAGVEHWANYFDLPHIDEVVLNNGDPRSASYKLKCKEVLKQIYDGEVEIEGKKRKIYDLETDSAEAVIGNMYAELFGINPGDSLAKVKSMGLDYFTRSVENTLRAPAVTDYDIVFLKTNGQHAFVTFSDPDNRLYNELEWRNTVTKDNGEIVVKRGQKELYTVGRWNDMLDDSIDYVQDKKIFVDSKTRKAVDQSMYRYVSETGKVQKRYDLVKRYERLTSVKNSKGEDVSKKLMMYRIADQHVFDMAYLSTLNDKPEIPEYAKNKASETVTKLYKASDYEIAEATSRPRLKAELKLKIADSLDALSNEMALDPLKKRMLETQRNKFRPDKDGKRMTDADYLEVKEEFIRELAKRKHTSFNESLKIIAGRIPATGMQSFMTMKIVGWTGRSSNEAYVSHFQIYLQGSDFDVDKANIMSSAFDSSGVYVGWSPYFDYTSEKTLNASKKIPVPDKRVKEIRHAKFEIRDKKDPNKIVQKGEKGVDITDELGKMLNNSSIVSKKIGDNKIEMLSAYYSDEDMKVNFLDAFAKAYDKVCENNGIYTYDSETLKRALEGENVDTGVRRRVNAAVNSLIEHNKYVIPHALFEKAALNQISSKCWEISSDVRNALESNTPITTRNINSASKKTPKARNANALLPDNPNEKYSSMVDAVSAKRVTAIGANGGKGWNSVVQFVNMAIESGDEKRIRRTMFNYDSKMIESRSSGIINAQAKKVRFIPDLDLRNPKVLDAVTKIYASDPSTLTYADVENALSELTNAATDNQKLLLLDKINCTPEYAGMYIAILQLGFSVEDAVAFMTNPYAELAVSLTSDSIFERSKIGGKKKAALNAAKGKIKSKNFMRGESYSAVSPEFEAEIAEAVAENPELANILSEKKVDSFFKNIKEKLNSEAYSQIKDEIIKYYNILDLKAENEIESFDDMKSLDIFVQSFIYASVANPGKVEGKDLLYLSDLFKNGDMILRDYEVNDYLEHVDRLTAQIRNAVLDYTNAKSGLAHSERCERGIEYFMKDVEEMEKVDKVADELTTQTVAYLSLNQGLPWEDGEMFSKLSNMNRAITDRESALEIDVEEFYETNKDGSIAMRKDAEGNLIKGKNGNYLPERSSDFDELVNIIKRNSPQYVAEEKDFMNIKDGKKRLEAVSKKQAEYDEMICDRLDEAASRMIMGHFDITEAMRNKSYRKAAADYLDLIKAYSNSLDVVYGLPNYARMMDCLSLIYEMRKLTAKGRLLDTIYKRYGNNYMLKKDNINNIHSYIDEKIILKYLSDHNPIILNRQTDGFSRTFDNKLVDEFDLGKAEGQAAFKRFVEEVYFPELKAKERDNGFVRNVNVLERDGLTHLRATIDISNPYTTSESKSKFEAMVKGMAKMQDMIFEYDNSMSVSDVFYLYDLIENKGATNSESLRSVFKELNINRGEPGRFYHSISQYDRDLNYVPDFNERDFLINTAPVVKEGLEKYHDEQYVKVEKENGGYKIMEYDSDDKTYSEVPLNTYLADSSGDSRIQYKRMNAYMKWCPFLHPSMMREMYAHDVLTARKLDRTDVKGLILNRTVSGNVHMFIIC